MVRMLLWRYQAYRLMELCERAGFRRIANVLLDALSEHPGSEITVEFHKIDAKRVRALL